MPGSYSPPSKSGAMPRNCPSWTEGHISGWEEQLWTVEVWGAGESRTGAGASRGSVRPSGLELQEQRGEAPTARVWLWSHGNLCLLRRLLTPRRASSRSPGPSGSGSFQYSAAPATSLQPKWVPRG